MNVTFVASTMRATFAFSDLLILALTFARLPDGYTFYSVSQERIMDEMDEEAKRARMHGPKTGAN